MTCANSDQDFSTYIYIYVYDMTCENSDTLHTFATTHIPPVVYFWYVGSGKFHKICVLYMTHMKILTPCIGDEPHCRAACDILEENTKKIRT